MDSRGEEGLSGGTTLPNCVPRMSLVSDVEDETSEGEIGRGSGQKAEVANQKEEHLTLMPEAARGKVELKREDDGWDLRSMQSTV